jgi:hypothetical protein
MTGASGCAVTAAPRKGESRTGREAARMSAEAGCVWVISHQFWCPGAGLDYPVR